MQFYGVGTRFGGTDCFLDDCCKYNFWCMGNPNEKQMKLYEGINVGDILIAKKYRMKDGAAFVDVEPEKRKAFMTGHVIIKFFVK